MKRGEKQVNKILMFIVLVTLVIGFSGCTDKPIGGERDEHGCLGPAGYTWNETVNACIREWELNENQKQAAKIAVEYVGYEKGITVIQVDVARCPGCFAVELEKGKDRIKVTLENWEVKSKSLTPEECEAKGGKPVNTVGGVSCEENEENIGEVTGFISPHICCKVSEEDCAKEGEQFSSVYADRYAEDCCEGLTEWYSGMDTRISIADECYETGLLAGSPVGTCINCGNGICEDIENPCNCPEDCIGKNSSNYLSVEEFCQSDRWTQTFLEACEETIKDFPLCELC